ncbi:mannose-P-dolichol utilization defect 1 protein-like protein [Pseudovirgaria hyperparasitica]|uniref:Mannose-P-dolichol utilization defect 1 protein homolog n=1 Tax=Pseudovirgaria hyperparasitica TaxID=470096 RepID=A0A6A6VYU6_9PEZI|nr:mannose-P-dolichol utilization defect 1 protein-like protein [Pseudovirgaria hyperparasitica]KAF2755016.1 mannose-P-dolichol utilization defect 1 protein-like protein [Pseudovirgaria hyperparasitica]
MDAIRPYVQEVTHRLPAPIVTAGRDLIGPYCYKTVVEDFDLLNHPECVKLGVSKALGIAIIGASAIVKVPQLIKLLQTKTAKGLSFTSYALETSAYIISLAYNYRHGFPFSTYGETALILIQNVAISALVLHFSGKGPAAGAWIAGLAATGYALFNENAGLVDVNRLAMFQAAAGVLGVASKIPQIWTVYQEGTTGQLSAFAVFNYLAGSLARVFTTLQEVPDPLILWGFIAGFVLNLVLAGQMIYYWNTAPAVKKSKGKNAPSYATVAKKNTPLDPATPAQSTRSKTPSTRRRG